MSLNTIYLGTISAGGDGHTLLMASLNARLRQIDPDHQDLLLEDFEFSDPETVTVPQASRNTKIYLGPTLESGYYGVRTLYYNRIHPNEFGDVTLAYDSETRIHQLIPKLNSKLGILILESDLVDGPITPPTAGDTITVDLEFQPTSVIYYSGTQIQLGNNNPSGEGVVTPFENALTFAFDQRRSISPEGETEQYVISTPFTMAVGVDNQRKRIAALSHVMQGTGSSASVRVRFNTATSEQMPIGRLPFVGYWRDVNTGTPRAISVFGDIYALNADAQEWTFVASRFGIAPNETIKAQAALTSPRVKFAVQDTDGSVYMLGRGNNDTPAIWKLSPDGTMAKVAVAASRLKSLTVADWDTCKIEDFLITDGRLWMIVAADSQYDIHATKGRRTPAVETINVSTLATNYYPLGDTQVRYAGIDLRTQAAAGALRWRLVTPPQGASHCDVVALLPTRASGQLVPVVYRYQVSSEYLAYILPITSIPVTLSQRGSLDICGYQIPLTTATAQLANANVAGHYLDVIEILTPAETNDLNRYFFSTNLRTKTKFLGYGLISLTCVSTRQGSSAWRETRISLESDYKPSMIALTDRGIRSHVIFQNGAAVHKSIFSQPEGQTYFTTTLDSSISLDNHTGYGDVARIGYCKWIKNAVAERSTPVISLSAPSDVEASGAPIVQTYIASGNDGVPVWITVPSNQTPARRNHSPTYAFMGSAPAALMSLESDLYYWCANGYGVFKSSDQGLSWKEFNTAPYMYRQTSQRNSNLNILGSAILHLDWRMFKKAIVTPTEIISEVSTTTDLVVYNVNAGNVNYPMTISDGVIYRTTPATGGTEYTELSPLQSFGLNLLSSQSPRSVVAWDVTPGNTVEVLGKYTINPTAPLAEDFGVDDYMFNTPGEMVYFNRDVKYYGIRHLFITKENGIYNLHFTDAVVPTRTIGLAGNVGSTFENLIPEAAFHIWSAQDDVIGYVPFIVYGNKQILLMERLDDTDQFEVTSHALTIPQDNGQPITVVPMFNANRKEYVFAQRGNGIFELRYQYDPVTEISSITAVRKVSLSGAAFATLTVHSGCEIGKSTVTAPMESDVPDVLPDGYEIGFFCTGTTKTARIADGQGGYREVVTPNHVDCGGSVTSRVSNIQTVIQEGE